MRFKQFIERQDLREVFWRRSTPRQKYISRKMSEPAKPPPMFSHGIGGEEDQMLDQSIIDSEERKRIEKHKSGRNIKKRQIRKPPEVS
jgi:hypothetical protein